MVNSQEATTPQYVDHIHYWREVLQEGAKDLDSLLLCWKVHTFLVNHLRTAHKDIYCVVKGPDCLQHLSY